MDVIPMEADANIGIIKIENNPKVKVHDFVYVMQKCFSEHGLKTMVVRNGYKARSDEYLVKYKALRSWDFVTFLSLADVSIYKGEEIKAMGHWHLISKGGLTISKFFSTEYKMEPFFDEILKNYKKQEIRWD